MSNLSDLPICERPAGRLQQYGVHALSLAEIVAAVLGGPDQLVIATQLVCQYKSARKLARASLAELMNMRGIGKATACRLKAALELGLRMFTETEDLAPQIRSPADAYALVQNLATLEQEELHVLLLDTHNRAFERIQVYRGMVDTLTTRPAELFRDAIRQNAVAIVIAHNHPSGDPMPSPEDIDMTVKMVTIGDMLGINVMDHIIVAGTQYKSLKALGLGFQD